MPDVIICANFDVKKLRGLGYTGGQILESPLEMAGHPYKMRGDNIFKNLPQTRSTGRTKPHRM